jgi:hypothetical protein
MTKGTKLSQDTFEKLIARASEIDAQGKALVDIERARQIAMDLGITPEAWNAAVREHSDAVAVAPAPPPRSENTVGLVRTGLVAVSGLVAGVLLSQVHGSALIPGALMVAASLELVRRNRHRGKMATVAEMTALWVAVPTGIFLDRRELLTDPLWFAMWSWIGCAAFMLLLPRLTRLSRLLTGREQPQS